MLRYNHAVIERKWRRIWQEEQYFSQEDAQVCTVLVPGDSGELGMENARLLVLTDFFASVYFGKKVPISVCGGQERWFKEINTLGLFSQARASDAGYELAVLPRDYVRAMGELRARDTLYCGRLLRTESMRDLLPDFGVDALRIYFLYIGPLARDYVFQWHGLAGAYRFVTKLWQLGHGSLGEPNGGFAEPEHLGDLRLKVQERILQRKPHTALAAIMGYIKNKSMLTRVEARIMATLLQPFTPFLSAELLELMASIED